MIDYGVYINDYLHDVNAKIQPQEWEYYATQAQQEVSIYVNALPLDNDKVKMCICEVADCLFDNAKNDNNISSESVGDVKITYTDRVVKMQIYKAKIKSVVYKWLADTGLIYRGIG